MSIDFSFSLLEVGVKASDDVVVSWSDEYIGAKASVDVDSETVSETERGTATIYLNLRKGSEGLLDSSSSLRLDDIFFSDSEMSIPCS